MKYQINAFGKCKKTFKLTSLAIYMILSFIISGCSLPPHEAGHQAITTSPVESNEDGEIYNNGIFIGYSDASDHGYAMAIVTIEKDSITDVVLKEFTELSVEKDFSTYEYEPSVRAHKELPQKFVSAGSSRISGISGATASSSRYRQAVERALASAKKQKIPGLYFNGIFQGRSKADNHGYGIALVKIQDDKIVNVELKEVNERGELIDFTTYPYEPSKRAFREIPNRFIKKNSWDIDNFTGATHSTEKYKEAVENAMAKAKKQKDLPDLIDGTYTSTSDADSQGYSRATVTIENNTISDVILREFDELALEKDFSNYEYEPSVKANRELPWAFISSQSARVDAVTGATHSSEHYSQAVERALSKASLPQDDRKYFDGVFEAKSTTDDHGYCIAIVTIKDDKIQEVVLKDVDQKGRVKDFENYPYEPSRKAYAELPEKFIRANSYEVDGVAGATYSSEKYKEAVKNALQSAALKSYF